MKCPITRGDAIAQTDSSGSTTNSTYNEYVFFAGRSAAQCTGPGAIFYYFADYLGTSREIGRSTVNSGSAKSDFKEFARLLCIENETFFGRGARSRGSHDP